MDFALSVNLTFEDFIHGYLVMLVVGYFVCDLADWLSEKFW